MRIHSVAALLIAVSSLLANAHAAESTIAIQDPYVRLVPPGIKATGGFMLLRNTGATDRQLIKAASPIAGVAELHTHLNENGVMKMREIPEIEACYSIAGEANYLLKVRVSTPGDLEDLLSRIRTGASVSTHTTIVLSTPWE